MTPIKIIVNVLDDQQYILDLIKDMFDGMPEYEVYYFTNPSEFTHVVDINTDLVITDVRVGSGFDVISSISKINDQSPSTYIIVMSAYFNVDLMQKLMRLSVRDTVVKTENAENWIGDLYDAIVRLQPKMYKRAEIKATINAR